ncbi:MAG: hypothetical protein Q9181_001666 [Wetmoreana brouardii]
MPRTFKFSFPLPGRTASCNSSPGAVSTPNDSHDDSPFYGPGSKAERILGTMDSTPAPNQSSKASKEVLRKKSSFMSVTISDAESESAAARNGFPFPGMPSSRGSSRRPSYTLRNQPSSPLLDARCPKLSPGTDSMTDNSSPRPHFYSSSSTLRSYYDPVRSPLLVSQQTSASSARDMALRKGYPSISSPLSQDVSEEISPTAVEDEKRPGTDTACGKRPTQLDLSDLFPQPQTATGPLLSPDQVSKSPSQLSFSSSQRSASTGRPSWWKRKKANESKPKEPKPPPDGLRLDEGLGVQSLKMNVRRPKAGMQHWFDGTGDSSTDTQHEHINADKNHRQFWNGRLDNLRPETHESPGDPNVPKDDNGPSPGKGPLSSDSATSIQLPLRQGSPNSQSKDALAPTSQRRARSGSLTSVKSDLLNQSFLELSSSSDDENEESANQPHDYRRHRIRDSIDQNDMGEDVIVTQAERVRPVKPKPVVNTSPRRSKRESEVIPPVPKIPERPRLQQRVSSMKWQERTSPKPRVVIAPSIDSTTSSSGDASIASQASYSFRSTAFDTPARKFGHGSRLMRVTVEESELLEALRKKRAGARPNDIFSPGSYTRPKTTGTTTEGGASYIGTYLSPSPPPSLPALHESNTDNHTTTNNDSTYVITNGPHSPFRFPEVPLDIPTPRSIISNSSKKTPRQAPPIVFPPPKASPTESFSPSDILPSTPRSRLSPLTPPPLLATHEGGKGIGGGRKRHERKRTMSSGVVMLDDVRERGGQWESEEEWGFGREERW